MSKAVTRANKIMRPLKDYIELGIKNKEVLKVVEILNQLDNDELTFIMAKYVKFAERDPTPRQIKLPKPKQVYEHLGMCVADYRSLQSTLSNKIYELYYEDYFEQYTRDNAGI